MHQTPSARPADGHAASDTARHTLTADSALSALGSERNGLSRKTIGERLAVHGPNTLPARQVKSLLALFADQFRVFMIAHSLPRSG